VYTIARNKKCEKSRSG